LIVDNPERPWIWVHPSKPAKPKRGRQAIKDYFEHYGKWLIFSSDGSYLDELARNLDPYVERGEIDSVKYNRESSSPNYKGLVMCVYCDDREKERVWEVLNSLGVARRIWKYDRQTFEDWHPGGRLREKAERAGDR